MSYQYAQSTGILLHNGGQIAQGYSGNGQWMNDPASQSVHAHGPLPQGRYTIQPPSVHPKLGPVAMELTPWNGNNMFLRGDFFIHGDNTAMDHTASDGCIILAHDIRAQIAQAVLSGDNELEVTA